MKTFLIDAKTFLAEHIDGGSTPDQSRVTARINEVARKLLNKSTAPSTLIRERVNIFNGYFTPSREIDGLYGVLRNGQPVTVFNQLTEFSGNGPGAISLHKGDPSWCVHKGSSPLYYDLQGYKQIYFVSNSLADVGKTVVVRGLGAVPVTTYSTAIFTTPAAGVSASLYVTSTLGFYVNAKASISGGGNLTVIAINPSTNCLTVVNDQTPAGVPGTVIDLGSTVYGPVQPLPVEETCVIQAQGIALSVNHFVKVDSIRKPLTVGQLYTYGFDAGTGASYLQALYHKNETSPEYKRYLLPGLQGYTGQAEILGKKAFIPAYDDGDELVIGNLDALRFGCLASWAEVKEDLKSAQALWAASINELEMSGRDELGSAKPMLGMKFLGTVKNII